MKPRMITWVLGALLASGLAVSGQDDLTVTDAPMTTEPSVTATNVAPPAQALTGDAEAQMDEGPTEETSVETTPMIVADQETTEESSSTNSASDPVIPLIVMDEVPLTDAIKNLARQANLNYMLDPKINYGQPGPDGRIVPQPLVSIRWENVTAGQALNALLNNYNLRLVDDPRTHIARITIKDPAAPDPLVTRIIQLQYANPSNILAGIRALFVDKRSKVVADIRTSQLVVLATEKELDAIDAMVRRLDTQTKQVLIEARLLETSINPRTVKGLDWRGTLEQQNIAAGNNLQSAPVLAGQSDNKPLSTLWPKLMLDTSSGFNPGTAFLDASGVNAVFSFINQNAEAKVLSAPRTVTLDNETATISVTRASPIINITPSTTTTAGGSQVTYTNLGVILNVTPRISANNYINLRVIPEVSRIFNTVRKEVAIGFYEADQYDIRRIETHVMIPSGNTLVLGGLVQDDERTSNTKVPLMGDIPVIGAAFRSNARSREKANLLIFITPTIIQEHDYQPTTTEFLKTPLPREDTREWSAWDDAKPVDWSKPVVEQYRPNKPVYK